MALPNTHNKGSSYVVLLRLPLITIIRSLTCAYTWIALKGWRLQLTILLAPASAKVIHSSTSGIVLVSVPPGFSLCMAQQSQGALAFL